MPRAATYLMDHAFTFTFAVTGIPVDARTVHCIRQRPGDHDIWSFDLWIGLRVTRVMGFHRANFGLPIGLSVVELDRGTRQTDGWTEIQWPSFHNASPMEVGGIIIIISTMFMVLSSWVVTQVISRIHPVHLMDVEQRQVATARSVMVPMGTKNIRGSRGSHVGKPWESTNIPVGFPYRGGKNRSNYHRDFIGRGSG